MMHVEGDYAMVHAGLLPSWTHRQGARTRRVKSSRRCAARHGRSLMAHMYGNQPDHWDDALTDTTGCG